MLKMLSVHHTALISLLLCVCLTAYSEGACVADGKTYDEGEVWQEIDEDQNCIQHKCQPDGIYTRSKCDPEQNFVELATVKAEPATVNGEPTTEQPADTTSVPAKGCTVDEREVAVGEQVDVPGKCLYRACAGEDQWIMKACPAIGLAPGWIITPEDVSKAYPDCCGRPAPMLDIIPDVVKALQWSVGLKLTYADLSVDYGNELTPTQVKLQPTVDYWAQPDARYVLSMVDPDAPSRQNASSAQFLHWLIGNVPGNNVASGDVLAAYVGSGPPQGTGLHRYVFLLYKQPSNITFDEPRLDNKSLQGRRKFSIEQFSQKYNLSDPIALNFFVAQYDDYVPEVHKQLGISV